MPAWLARWPHERLDRLAGVDVDQLVVVLRVRPDGSAPLGDKPPGRHPGQSERQRPRGCPAACRRPPRRRPPRRRRRSAAGGGLAAWSAYRYADPSPAPASHPPSCRNATPGTSASPRPPRSAACRHGSAVLTRSPLGQLSQPHSPPHAVRLGMRTSVPIHRSHRTSSAVRVTVVAAASGDHKRRFAALAP
jgi:hypothetical protein